MAKTPRQISDDGMVLESKGTGYEIYSGELPAKVYEPGEAFQLVISKKEVQELLRNNNLKNARSIASFCLAQLHPTDRKWRGAILLVGDSAVGKTAMVKDFAKKSGLRFIHVMCSQIVPEALTIPTAPETKVDPTGKEYKEYDFGVPSSFSLFDGRPTLLFLDELTRAQHPSVINTLFSLINERMLNGREIDTPLVIVAAANPTGNIISLSGDNAMSSRFHVLHIEASPDEWLTWANSPEGGIHSAVTNFIRDNKGMFYIPPSSSDGAIPSPWPNPKSWEMVSEYVKYVEDMEFYNQKIPSKIIETHIASIVGSKAASEFINYLSTQHSIENLIKNLNQEDLQKITSVQFKDALSFDSQVINLSRILPKIITLISTSDQAPEGSFSGKNFEKLAKFLSHWDKSDIEKLKKTIEAECENGTIKSENMRRNLLLKKAVNDARTVLFKDFLKEVFYTTAVLDNYNNLVALANKVLQVISPMDLIEDSFRSGDNQLNSTQITNTFLRIVRDALTEMNVPHNRLEKDTGEIKKFIPDGYKSLSKEQKVIADKISALYNNYFFKPIESYINSLNKISIEQNSL